MRIKKFIVSPGKNIRLRKYSTLDTGSFEKKKNAQEKLEKDIALLSELQAVLYAQRRYGLLIILQGMDASGKDGTIKHIMSGVNPQGVFVHSFKEPSEEERAHDYLWRSVKVLPARGEITIFNRSYYEEVLVARVHPDVLARQRLPRECVDADIWNRRFEEIRSLERYLFHNGIRVLKFFLHLSKEEQRRRLLDRIDTPRKNWKFSADDLATRRKWNAFQRAYEDMLRYTSTAEAPWYVIPADHKWYSRVAVASIIISVLESLSLEYPRINAEQKANLRRYKKMLKK